MSEAELAALQRRYRLEDLKRIDQADVKRKMIEDESGHSPTDPDKCILPPEHPNALSYMRIGQIWTPKEGGFRWRRYLWPPEGGSNHAEFRTDASGRGLWEGPLGGHHWKQQLIPEEFDLNKTNPRALVVQYHLRS